MENLLALADETILEVPNTMSNNLDNKKAETNSA